MNQTHFNDFNAALPGVNRESRPVPRKLQFSGAGGRPETLHFSRAFTCPTENVTGGLLISCWSYKHEHTRVTPQHTDLLPTSRAVHRNLQRLQCKVPCETQSATSPSAALHPHSYTSGCSPGLVLLPLLSQQMKAQATRAEVSEKPDSSRSPVLFGEEVGYLSLA